VTTAFNAPSCLIFPGSLKVSSVQAVVYAYFVSFQSLMGYDPDLVVTVLFYFLFLFDPVESGDLHPV